MAPRPGPRATRHQKAVVTMRAAFLFAVTSALISPAVWPAVAVEMQPGLWEQTTKVERDGAVSTRSPRRKCVTAESASIARSKADFGFSAKAHALLRSRFGRDACKLIDAKNSQYLISWRLRCTGNPSAEQEGTVRFDRPRHYKLTIRTSMTSAGKTVTSVLTAEGRYVGECSR